MYMLLYLTLGAQVPECMYITSEKIKVSGRSHKNIVSMPLYPRQFAVSFVPWAMQDLLFMGLNPRYDMTMILVYQHHTHTRFSYEADMHDHDCLGV